MKKIFILLGLVAVFGFGRGPRHLTDKEEIHFFAGTWSQALEKARQENKPIFLDIYATWCGPCRLLKSKTFTNPEVVKFYDTHFINVSLDGEKGEGLMLASKYQIPGYPSLLILDYNERPVFASAGYMPAREFLKFGKVGLKKAGK
ncbi:MAG: thioredoxin family protein [Bacteroidota bacterium]|nr:thioredoxin family protein [Bacteroidota bacterium]